MCVALANLHGFVIVNMREKKVVQRVELPSEHDPDATHQQRNYRQQASHHCALLLNQAQGAPLHRTTAV